MRTLTTENNMPVVIDGKMEVGVYPYPHTLSPELIKLGLVRGSHLVEIHTGTESVADTDAAVCDNRKYTLGIRTRDCAPICFSDGKQIAIAHVGWQGFSAGLVEKTLAYFNPQETAVYIAPFLHVFEIQKDACYDALMAKPGTEQFIREEEGKLMFYFQEAIAALLPDTAIFDTRDTATDMSLPSHRAKRGEIGFLTTVRFI